jgi:CTP:molybdopterin cytidylyltransferase MocA
VSHNVTMTVAAVILAASAESALADVEGLPRVRRLADLAWSGGALPIVVVAPDPAGTVAVALAGAPVTLAEPAPARLGPAGQMARGMEVAAAQIHETDGAIIWPARLVWVGPETITSLIEAHGLQGEAVISPTYLGEHGWPVLLPASALGMLRRVGPDRMPDEVLGDLLAAGLPDLALDLGDPGTVMDASTARDELPPYDGPPAPVSGLVHEWGAPVADEEDDAPLSGPSLAPYPQAHDEDEG